MIRDTGQIKHPTDDTLPCAVLQYADDTLIVSRVDVVGATKLKDILDQLAAFSGLHINFNKSTLVPIQTSEQIVSACVQIIGYTKGSFPQPYLGLPLSANKLPVSAFTIYIQKADKFLSSWQADLLNPKGWAVLVNSVLDSLLVYLMSSLQLPPSAIELMDKKRRAFLWLGDKTGHSSPSSCLIAWFKVCFPRILVAST